MGCSSSSETSPPVESVPSNSNTNSISRDKPLSSSKESLLPNAGGSQHMPSNSHGEVLTNRHTPTVQNPLVGSNPRPPQTEQTVKPIEASVKLFVRVNSKSNSVGGTNNNAKKANSRLSIDKDCFVSIVSPVDTQPAAGVEAFALSLNDEPPMEYKSLPTARRISKGGESVGCGEETRGSIPGLSSGNLPKDSLHGIPTKRSSQSLAHSLLRSPVEHPSPMQTSPRTSLVQFTNCDVFSLEDSNDTALPAYLRKGSNGVAHRRSSARRSPQRTDDNEENYSGSWSLQFGGDLSFRPAVAPPGTLGKDESRLSLGIPENHRCGNGSLTEGFDHFISDNAMLGAALLPHNVRSPCASSQSVRRLSFTSIDDEFGGDSLEASVNKKHREQLAKPKVRSAWNA